MNNAIEKLKEIYYKDNYVNDTSSLEKFVFAQNDQFFDIIDRKPVFNVLRLLGIEYELRGNGFYIDDRCVDKINELTPWEALSCYSKEYVVKYSDGKIEKVNFPVIESGAIKHNANDICISKNYVKIEKFYDESTIYSVLSKREWDNLTIDIRDNRGGNLQNMVRALSMFCDGNLFYLKNKKQKYLVKDCNDGLKIRAKKINIIVNNNTASSAEFFAETMRKKNNSIIIGNVTHGKWVAQTVLNYSNKNIKVPKYIYCGLEGNENMQRGGIIPDYICHNDSDISAVIGKELL